MKQCYVHISLKILCGVFGKSRQSYYEKIQLGEKRQMEDQLIINMVSQKRNLLPRVGGLKLHYLIGEDLKKHELKLGRDKLYKLLREKGLLIKTKKRGNKTTNSYHHFHKYKNLIRDLEIIRPNQVWVSDITYISIRKHHAYLSLITDSYSRKIIGFSLHETLEATGCIAALMMALCSVRQQVPSLIHHSDKGIQYCSHAYVAILKRNNIQISMTEKRDAYENAIAERVNGILKAEFKLDQCFYSFSMAKKEIRDAIRAYNEYRPHLSCNLLTPEEAHLSEGKLRRRWKNYYKIRKEM